MRAKGRMKPIILTFGVSLLFGCGSRSDAENPPLLSVNSALTSCGPVSDQTFIDAVNPVNPIVWTGGSSSTTAADGSSKTVVVSVPSSDCVSPYKGGISCNATLTYRDDMDASPTWTTVALSQDYCEQQTVSLDISTAHHYEVYACNTSTELDTCSDTFYLDVNPVLNGTTPYDFDTSVTFGKLCPCCSPDNGLASRHTAGSHGWRTTSSYDSLTSSSGDYTPDYSEKGSSYIPTTCSINVTAIYSTTGENATKTARSSKYGVYCVNRVDHGNASAVLSQLMSCSCTSGVCDKQPVGAVCRTASDCNSGSCIGTTMRGSECPGSTHYTCGCASSSDCASGKTCNANHQCTCSTTADCPGLKRDPDLICYNGVCT
jgi:hypothetical protein